MKGIKALFSMLCKMFRTSSVHQTGEGILMATRCGHETDRCGEVSAFGCTVTTHMPVHEDGSVDYCLACIGKMAIRCAWCGKPIFIGDPITLYNPTPNFNIPEYAVTYSTEPLQLVGCLRFDCARTGADRSGFWLPNDKGVGYVMRVPTIFERILSGEKFAMIRDMRDIKEALGN